MKGHGRIRIPRRQRWILILPFLDCALLLGMVLTFRENRPEPALFLLFYLLCIPHEIVLRGLFGKKGPRPWHTWAGWICRWAGIVLILLSVVHLLLGGSWKALLPPGLYDSGQWTALAIRPLRLVFSVTGFVLMLGRKETRKKSLFFLFIVLPVLLFLIGILGGSGALDNDRPFSILLTNLLVFLIPHLHGLGGALFYPLYGKKLEKEAAARKAARTQPPANRSTPASPAAAASVSSVRPAVSPTAPPPRTVSPAIKAAPVRAAAQKPAPAAARPAAPRNIERELADRKAAYEARMRRRSASGKETPDTVPVDEMLKETADRLFNEGRAAASLGGQRQLICWMVRAVPELADLIRRKAGKQFFARTLPDDPEVFLPLLDALLTEAARLLENNRSSAEEAEWKDADPESLCAAWYALTRYAAVSRNGSVFTQESNCLKKRFEKDPACYAWLKNTFESMEERKAL